MMALRRPTMRLNSVDLPTLCRPTSAIFGMTGVEGGVDTIFLLSKNNTKDLEGGPSPMIKVDIINEVSRAADITKVKAEVAVEAVLEAMKDSMMKGERIELRGFGVFQVKPRKRGIGRNPRTGKEVKIPPGRTIRFKPGKDLQNLSQ